MSTYQTMEALRERIAQIDKRIESHSEKLTDMMSENRRVRAAMHDNMGTLTTEMKENEESIIKLFEKQMAVDARVERLARQNKNLEIAVSRLCDVLVSACVLDHNKREYILYKI